MVSVSADRPDPSIDEPTEAPSEDSDDGSTSKHRRDPTLIGIPQREPRRGGWFEAGARSTDPRLKLPEFEEGEGRSGWNSVADRPRKATESAFPGPPRSKVPPPPSISARKIQPPRKKRISSSPPPADEQPAVAAVSPAPDDFAALGDPDAKNERLPSLAPQRPSEKLVGLSEPPASADPAPPSAPSEYAATVIDASPPDMDLLAATGEEEAQTRADEAHSVVEEPAAADEPANEDAASNGELATSEETDAVPENPAGLEAAKTTIDDQGPELFDATPLAPVTTADLQATSQAELPIPPFRTGADPMDDDDALSLRPHKSNRKWFIVLALVVAGVLGFLVWKLNEPPTGQPVQVVDKVVPPQPVPPKPTSGRNELPADTTGKTTRGPAGEENTGEENTGEENTGEESTGEENTGEENTGEENTGEENTNEQVDDPSLVEIMKAIEDANVPSQSRIISRMRTGAKARKARAHIARAIPHFRKKRYDRAVRYYVKALVFVPEHQEATEGIMHSLEARGELDKALPWAKRLVQLDSKNAMYWSYVGDLLRKLKRPVEAKVIYERALQENRKNKAAVAGLRSLGAE